MEGRGGGTENLILGSELFELALESFVVSKEGGGVRF